MKNIYLLHTCDGWKSKKSMDCIMATTSLANLRKGIIAKIKSNDIEYTRGEGDGDISIKKQIAMFNEDWKQDSSFACDSLEYGYVKIMENGALE